MLTIARFSNESFGGFRYNDFFFNSLTKFKKLKQRLKCIFKVLGIQCVPYSNIIFRIK